ncbi:hypothetical protein [Streptomyces sp. NPDC017958]|uniref:hypothetical protein n=1 Tax=Streptomyces sp. NPDC017958 TaxID=3365021 RepID=UPI0037B458EC
MGVSLRRITWARDLPLRYALVEEEWDGEQTLWARFADLEGLFAEGPPAKETLTIVGCRPTGRLRKAVEQCRLSPVPLGDLELMVEDVAAGTEDEWPHDHWWSLADVLVVDARAVSDDDALVDVVVEAVVYDGPGADEPAATDVRAFNGVSGDLIGRARRVEGLYRERPDPDPLHLIGCEPSPPLLARLVRPRHGGDGSPVELWALDRTGRPILAQEKLKLRVDECRPSALGGTLIDVTLRHGSEDRRPPGTRPVWDAWYEGRPREGNAWARFPTDGRHEWLRFTEPHMGPEVPGTVCRLDGRYVTDVPGLKCALGEAIAGPGYHFNQCWAVMRGCPCGGNLLRAPFTLVWHDADVAREALASISVDTAGELTYYESVVRFLQGLGITVLPR